MNFMKQFSNKEKELLNKAGIKVEDREYNTEELKKYELEIGEYIMSHSAKNGDIPKLHEQYSDILHTFARKA